MKYLALFEGWINEALTSDQIANEIQVACAGLGTTEPSLAKAILSIPDVLTMNKVNLALKSGFVKAFAYIIDILDYITLTEDDIDAFVKYCGYKGNKEKLIEHKHIFNEFQWYDICMRLDINDEHTETIRIYNLKKKSRLSDIGECSICFTDNTLLIPINWCLHMFCTDCYKKLYKDPCPYCRCRFTDKS